VFVDCFQQHKAIGMEKQGDKECERSFQVLSQFSATMKNRFGFVNYATAAA